MIDKLNSIIHFFDVGDVRFFFLIGKKNFRNLTILTLLISIFVLIVSMNLEKKYISQATIVISPEENNIVNIEEVYSITNQASRVNNQIAILKSDEVLEYIVGDKKSRLQFKDLYAQTEVSFFKRIFKKKINVDKDYLKSTLTSNFSVTNVPRSDVLQLSFISNNPKVSQLALKSIIDSYQRYEVDSKIQITNYANIKISDRLKELVKQMDIAEKKLAEYKKENELVDTGDVKGLKIKEIQSISERILEAEKNSQKLQNDLLSIKVADGNVDDLLAIKELRTAKEISDIQDSLSANESNIQSLSLINTNKHPKLAKAQEFHQKLKSQLKEKINISIQQKAFELGNMDNFIKLSQEELKEATDELRLIEEKESGMMKFAREVESSKKLYESFLQRVKETNEAQNLQVSKLKVIETPNLPSGPG